MLKVGILEGDDIGLEVVPECVKVMRPQCARPTSTLSGLPFPIARRAHEQCVQMLPPGALEARGAAWMGAQPDR
jgi:3-isopropylmalate dehydrogenase